MSDLTTVAAKQAAEYYESLYAGGYIAVGDGETAFNVADTALAGTNQARAAITASSVSDGVITFTAEFGTGSGNFEWLEIGVFDAATAGNLFVRKLIDSIGTKPASQTWGVEATITIAAAT